MPSADIVFNMLFSNNSSARTFSSCPGLLCQDVMVALEVYTDSEESPQRTEIAWFTLLSFASGPHEATQPFLKASSFAT